MDDGHRSLRCGHNDDDDDDDDDDVAVSQCQSVKVSKCQSESIMQSFVKWISERDSEKSGFYEGNRSGHKS